MINSQKFSVECRQCERLASFLDEVKTDNPDYFCKPVPEFGDPEATLLVVGLAPGMHGANRSGRPFTGDHAGILLYQTLFDHGFASKPESLAADDGLELLDCRITNAVKCLPPQNKPTAAEINTCRNFLREELLHLPENSVILALGTIAHKSIIASFGLRQVEYKFAHEAEFELPGGRILLDSYHCSAYNTSTKRLTPEMFNRVFARAREIIG